MTDLSDGWVVGDGITLSWPPLDEAGDPITGAASSITLTIKEPGQSVITKTGADLSEDAGTYTYVHKIATPGPTYGDWVYDGAGNADGVEEFKYYVGRRETSV